MPELLHLDDPEIPVRLNVTGRARRFTLRLSPGGEQAVLTLPPGVPMSEVRMFLLRQSDWLRGAIDRQGRAVDVAPGVSLPVDGLPRLVVAEPGPRRAPRLEAGRLVLSGSGDPGRRIAVWLKARARDRMVPAAHGFAGTLGVKLAAVTFKDTRSRWGSCSVSGRINLSWRLAMAPEDVQQYVIAHEVAHLVEMNHQPAYWSVLARLMPNYEEPRTWLRRRGRTLHSYRFG